jgi:F0F1-type ATP synthase assembly protein I
MPPAPIAIRDYRTDVFQNAPAPRRRRSNGRAKAAIAKARKSAARARAKTRKIEETMGTQGVLYAAAGFVGGAAVAGVMGAAIDTTWGGFDVRLIISAALIGVAAFGVDDPLMSIAIGAAGLGVGAPAIATTVDEALSGVFN